MLQAALMITAHSANQSFVIVTQSPNELSANLAGYLEMCGVKVEPERFAIMGLEQHSPDSLAKELLARMEGMPAMAGAIFDCNSLVEHADKVRALTKFPVFDQVTLLDFYHSARADNPYFGTCYNEVKGSVKKGEVKHLVKKAERRLFSPFENYKASLMSRTDASATVGILRIEYSYPPIPGDIAHEGSYGYKVRFEQVDGLTFEKAQNAVLDDAIQESFKKAVKKLEEKGVVAITGDCGFMMAYQPYVRALTDIPVLMSSILQAPMLVASHEPDAKFAIFTANSSTFDKEKLLVQSGMMVDPKQWIVVGLQDLDGFEAVALGQKVPAEKVQPAILKCVKNLMATQPNLRGFLLECTELPHYADAIRAQSGLPVVDAITLVDYFQNSCTALPSFSKKALEALAGALDPRTAVSLVGVITAGTLGTAVGFTGKILVSAGSCACAVQ
jgi:aspartate/glutamate racemase